MDFCQGEIRNEQGKLFGYAVEEEGKRYLAIIKKNECIGKINVDDLYMQITKGPCCVLEYEKNKYKTIKCAVL